MINLADIFFSTAMVLLIMVRAAIVDRQKPWFTREDKEPDGQTRKPPIRDPRRLTRKPTR